MDDNKYYEERSNTNEHDTNPYQYNPQNPYDSRPPKRPRPNSNPLALASFLVGIVSFVVCCCSPNFLMIGSVIAIGLAVCSKLFYRDAPMHGLAIAAIVIGCVGIILNICMLILSFVWLPQYLNANPEIVEEIKTMFSQYGYDLSNIFYE